MSRILKANLNALGLEADTIRADLRAVSALAIPSQYGLLEKAGGAPSSASLVEATNIVTDPQGLGPRTTWVHGDGVSVAPNDAITLPDGWSRAMELTDLGGTDTKFLYVSFTATVDGLHYWYAFARHSYPAPVTVALAHDQGDVDARTIPAGLADSWWLCRGSAQLTAGQRYWIAIDPPDDQPAGNQAWLTGVTVCPLADPDGPFSGDTTPTERHLYSWQGPRNNSISQRRGQTVDLLALREQTARLDIAPVGLSIEQRCAYLLARRKARHHGDGATFVQLIVEMIRTEDPTFQPADVRIVENFENGSMSLQIAYNPSGDLAARITRLIDDIKPYPIAVDSIVWGTFRADISQADVDPVG